MQAKSKQNDSPKGYLSWSQLNMWEKDPNLYYQVYIEGIDQFRTKYLELGKRLADGLEVGFDKERDPMYEMIIIFAPKILHKEFQIPRLIGEGERAGCKCKKCLARGIEKPLMFEGIPLYGKLDGFDDKKLEVLEIKSGKKWTQKMVNDLGQITFYAFLVWLKYGVLPKKIYLYWARTDEDPVTGKLFLTGETKTFETVRTMKDIILFSKRIKTCWVGVCELGKMVDY